MKEIYVVAFCDYPECSDTARKETPEGQETFPIDFWVNVIGRGRKTVPIKVELCAEHLAELRGLFTRMQKHDSSQEAESE